MKSFIFVAAAAAAAFAAPGLVQGQGGQENICGDAALTKCQNGLFNQELCACDCIPPYCPDLIGDCTNPSNKCDNPWTECEKGVDCPWWNNLLTLESCATGWEIPVSTWEVYSTRQACCNANYPYSNTCNGPLAPEPPSKHPTINAPEETDYEIVSLRFDVTGIPDDVSMMELKEEMETVLTRILLRLADRVEGLSVTNVEQTVPKLEEAKIRGQATVYFNVEIVRAEGSKFGPLIIQAVRDSYDELLEQIYAYSDTSYFGAGVGINLCTLQTGAYTLCVKEIKTPAPTPKPTTPVVGDSAVPEDDEGLAGWAISLTVIFVLSFVCCIGYAIAVVCFGVANCFDDCFRDRNDTKEIHNNIYWDDRSRDDKSRGSRRSRKMLAIENRDDRSRLGRKNQGVRPINMLAIESGNRASENANALAIEDGSRASGYASQHAIILAKPEGNDSLTLGSERYSRSAQSHGKKSRQGRDPTMYIPGQEDKPDPQNSQILRITQGRDPTMYLPGQEDKSDPNSGSGWFSESNISRGYYEDILAKPKREPTMYVDGIRYDEDPPLKLMREPTMYLNRETDTYDGEMWDATSTRKSSSVIPYATEFDDGVQRVDNDFSYNKSSVSIFSYHEKGESASHRELSVAGTKSSKKSKRSKASKHSKSSYGSG